MSATAIIDITSAVFLSVVIASRFAERRSSKDYRQLCLGMILIFVLLSDALSYILDNPSLPVPPRYILTYNSLVVSAGTILLGFTYYVEGIFLKRASLNPWVFRTLKLAEAVWMIAASIYYFTADMISYPNGVEVINYDFPPAIRITEAFLLIAPTLIAILIRKEIGLETAVLTCLFAFASLIAFVLYTVSGVDFSYAACTLTFISMDEFIRKKQTDEQKREHVRQLDEARIAAEKANSAKTSFLFSMSHDIRTPMNAIRGFTTMAKTHIDDPKQVLEYLDKIDISGQQLLTLINQVLEMARIESGKVEFEENPVNVKAEFGSMVTVLSEQAKSMGLQFKYKLGKIKHSNVYADEARMGSITLNIVGNAIKYTPEGGTIRYELREVPERKPGYAAFNFIVSDTGIGMSKEFLEKLYEPFARENSSTVSKIQGTGLGLSIVKSTIDLLDGDIEVTSDPGKGTRVSVTLDFKINTSKESPVDKEEDDFETVSFTGRRVLLTDDNEMNREIAKAILEEQGFIVETAEDGDVAVKKVEEKLKSGESDYYDIVLMDVQMPRMNGYEATKAIRAMEEGTEIHIPVIAMTANAFEEDKKDAFACGMDGHLAKPIDVLRMLKMIAKVLQSD